MTPQTPTRGNDPKQAHAAVPQAGNCGSCGSIYLRRSKWRQGDGIELCKLLLPVRCMTCLKREHIPFWRARKAMPAQIAHSGDFASQASWQDFTKPGSSTDAAPKDRSKGAA